MTEPVSAGRPPPLAFWIAASLGVAAAGALAVGAVSVGAMAICRLALAACGCAAWRSTSSPCGD